jgi:hypothetical protein
MNSGNLLQDWWAPPALDFRYFSIWLSDGDGDVMERRTYRHAYPSPMMGMWSALEKLVAAYWSLLVSLM